MSTEANPAKIFVGNLPADQPKEAAEAFFGVCGKVVNLELPEGRNYGWVTFAEVADAESAVKELHEADFLGSTIRVEPFKPRERRVRAAAPAGDIEKRTIENSLYVGNIPRRMEDGKKVLETEFGIFGDVRGVTYNRVRGYGYVRYEDASSVEAAIKAKQGEDLGGRPLRLETEQRVTRKSARKSGKKAAPRQPAVANPLRVFFGNLPAGLKREDVAAMVQNVGPITGCRFGNKGAYVFVDFETEEQAKNALKMNGAEVSGKELRVEPHKPVANAAAPKAKADKKPRQRKSRQATSPPNPSIVWIGGIHREISEDDVRAAMGTYGTITHVEIHTRHAFITYATPEAAAAAAAQSEQTIKDATVGVSLSLRRPPPVNPTRIFVGNLPEGVTDEEVRAAFSHVGEVTNMSIAPAGGSGYISFDSADAASAAVERMAGQDFKGHALRVEPARPRRSRRRAPSTEA